MSIAPAAARRHVVRVESGEVRGVQTPGYRATKAWSCAVLVAGTAAAARGGEPAGDAAYGAYLAAECASCHTGAGGGGIPSLHGLPPERLAALLADYRDGKRTNPAMQAVARSLGPAEVTALAAYLAARPEAP